MPNFAIPESAQDFIGLNFGPRVDREGKHDADPDGQPLWEVRVATIGDPEPGQLRAPMPDILRVTVAGAAPRIVKGAPIRFSGLQLRSWKAKDGREGLMYFADGIAATNGMSARRLLVPRPRRPLRASSG